MREGRASLTAMIVACARAAADVDPIAERLVPRPFGRAMRRLRGSRVARVMSLGLVTHLEHRTKRIDEVIERERPRQLVVLGAGLDARAWRMGALADTVVFEVDHPSTQADKRARIGEAELRAREVRFVGVDFERDDLGERLAASGHDAKTKTTWIWEGVTPYLTPDAIGATLDVVAARSAPGSAIVVTYVPPDHSGVLGPLRAAVEPAFRILGEPLRGLMTPAEAAAVVEAHGMTVEEDDAVVAHADRRLPFEIAERMLVARRQ